MIDPETGAVLPDGEKGELVFTSLTKAGLSDHPLPHPRPDAAAARHRPAGHAADGEGNRAFRRHDHLARRQRIPDPEERCWRPTGARPFHHRTDARGRIDGMTVLAEARPKAGTAADCPRTPKRCRSPSRTPSASPHASGPSPPIRWNVARQGKRVYDKRPKG